MSLERKIYIYLNHNSLFQYQFHFKTSNLKSELHKILEFPLFGSQIQKQFKYIYMYVKQIFIESI